MPSAGDLLKEGDAAFRARDYARATELFQQAAAAADPAAEAETLVEALAQTARGYLIRDLKDEGRGWLEKAGERASEAHPNGWSRYLGVRGRFEWKDGDLAAATRTFETMYDYCMKHTLHSRAIDAAHMVAITGTPGQQVEWGRKGIQAAEAAGDEGWLGPLWNNLGWTYDREGKFGEALDALRRARHFHWKLGSELAKLIADWAVGHALRQVGNPTEALAWIRPVLAWAERRQIEQPTPEAAEWVGHACRELGEIRIALGDREEGLRLLRRAREELQRADMPRWDAADFSRLQERITEVEREGGGVATAPPSG